MQLSTKSLTRGAAGGGEGVRGPNGGGNPDAGVGAITPSIDGALWTSSAQRTVCYSDRFSPWSGSTDRPSNHAVGTLSFDAVSATGGSTSTLHITNGQKDV